MHLTNTEPLYIIYCSYFIYVVLYNFDLLLYVWYSYFWVFHYVSFLNLNYIFKLMEIEPLCIIFCS